METQKETKNGLSQQRFGLADSKWPKKMGQEKSCLAQVGLGHLCSSYPPFTFVTFVSGEVLIASLILSWKVVEAGETSQHLSTCVQEHLVSDRNSHIFKYTQFSLHSMFCVHSSVTIVCFVQSAFPYTLYILLYFVQTWTKDDRRTVETCFKKVLFIFLNLLHIFSFPDLTIGNDHQWRNLLIGKQILLVST